MANVNGNAPKIILYTNHNCPWAHRVHIVLKVLGLEYEEVIIDLDKPREQWYLDINPRGLVPCINFDGEIISESGIVAQFLADKYPSPLLPVSTEGALTRARIGYFVDTWFSKAGSFSFQTLLQDTEEEKEKIGRDFVDVVAKEIEPLLKDAGPFFGGSNEVTFAEALTAPFILRVYALAKHNYLPQSIIAGFDKLPNFSKWAAEVIKQDCVTYIWDEARTVPAIYKRAEGYKAKKAASK